MTHSVRGVLEASEPRSQRRDVETHFDPLRRRSKGAITNNKDTTTNTTTTNTTNNNNKKKKKKNDRGITARAWRTDRDLDLTRLAGSPRRSTASLRAKILDFGGFD